MASGPCYTYSLSFPERVRGDRAHDASAVRMKVLAMLFLTASSDTAVLAAGGLLPCCLWRCFHPDHRVPSIQGSHVRPKQDSTRSRSWIPEIRDVGRDR
jgi:hypothetical protein